MAQVILHDYWRSSASYRVRIALALKGIAYDRVNVDLMEGAHRLTSHLALNAQGLVPVLEIDGLALTQSVAILEYLEERHPTPALLPLDAADRAHVRAMALAIACEIHPLSNTSVLARVEALAGVEGRAQWNRDNIARGLNAVEHMLDHKGFCGRFSHGETASMADCMLIPQLYNADRWDVPFDHLPRISAVAQHCRGLPAFVAAHPDQFNPSQTTKETTGETP